MTKHEILMSAYHDAGAILDELNIPYGPISTVIVNTRAKSFLGRCTYIPKLQRFKIEINSDLLEADYTIIMNTMIHELLHAHRLRFHDGHKGSWKICANTVTRKYPEYVIKRTASAEECGIINKRVAHYKYIITCNNCGHVNKYIRESQIVKLIKEKPDGSCKCGICGKSSFTLKSI